MGRFTPPFTVTQQKVLAIVPKVTSVPSIFGSIYIIQHVLRHEKRRSRTYDRILLGMSIMDFIYAAKSFASTWPLPAETPGVWGAVGSFTSCEVFGFLSHVAGLASAIYNGSLTIYFYMSIALGFKESIIRRRAEPWFHAIPLLVGLATGVACLPLNLFNPIGWTCWIGSYPPGCGGVLYPCQRGGENVDAYRWAFFHAQLWFTFALSGILMFLMYRAVRRIELSMEQYITFRGSGTGGGSSAAAGLGESLSRRVATQAWLYMSLFFITWIFPMVQFVVSYHTGYLYFPLLCLTVIINPMQGFFDTLIYLRPRYLKYRNTTTNQMNGGRRATRRPARWQAFQQAFSATNEDANHDPGEIFDPEHDDNTGNTGMDRDEKISEQEGPSS